MKIGDQKLQRTLKNQMVRRVLKDNTVPGTSAGTREAEAPGPEPTGSAARFLGESQTGLCDEARCLFRPRGLNRRNFSKKKKREKRGTQWWFREFSAGAEATSLL